MWRRDVALVALGVVVGPWLVAGLFLVGSSVARHGLDGLLRFDPAFLWETFPFSWFIPLIPSVIVAVANAVVGRVTASQTGRLGLALFIGALVFGFDLSWLAEDDATGHLNLAELIALGLAGALASLIQVALVDAFATSKAGGR